MIRDRIYASNRCLQGPQYRGGLKFGAILSSERGIPILSGRGSHPGSGCISMQVPILIPSTLVLYGRLL